MRVFTRAHILVQDFGDVDGHILSLKKAIEVDPNNIAALCNLGM